MQETFTIPAHRMDTLLPRLNKLVKKANRYGNDPVGYTIGATHIVEKTIHNEYNRPQKVQIEMMDITVWGNAPKYGDHTFAAKVEFMDGGEHIVHNIANITLDNRFRTMVNHCDHCGHNRVRNAVYVFTNANGEQLAVGSTCLRDFTGCDNPLEITLRATFANDIATICADEETQYFGSFGEAHFSAMAILQSASANIRNYGWVSKANCDYENGLMATSHRVANDLTKSNAIWNQVDTTDADTDMANTVLEYFRAGNEFDNDYLNNIRVILKSDVVAYRHMALVASGVQHIIRENAKHITTQSAAIVSEYMGKVGDKLADIAVIMQKEICIGTTQYGTKYLYCFNHNGNVINWFTDKKDFEVGVTYMMNATIKELKVYNGIKQTIITRAKIK